MPFYRTLLNYLGAKDILATFFVVGSRVIQYPLILVEEYMAGHEISVHTWSHRVSLIRQSAQVFSDSQILAFDQFDQ